jgi:hypothetical protein
MFCRLCIMSFLRFPPTCMMPAAGACYQVAQGASVLTFPGAAVRSVSVEKDMVLSRPP